MDHSNILRRHHSRLNDSCIYTRVALQAQEITKVLFLIVNEGCSVADLPIT